MKPSCQTSASQTPPNQKGCAYHRLSGIEGLVSVIKGRLRVLKLIFTSDQDVDAATLALQTYIDEVSKAWLRQNCFA